MKNQTIPVLGPTAKRLLAESEAKGEAKGRAESILLLLKAKGVIVDEPSRTRILDCRDSQVLDRWLLRGLQISSVQDLFTED